MIAVAEDKFKTKLTNEFIQAKAEIECRKVKTRFVGTFLENYEDILENLDKFVGENGREDSSCTAKLVEGNEIIEKDFKPRGSRYEMKPVYDEETLADVKHKEVFQDLAMLVCLIQIILTMLNTLLNVRKPSCPSSRFPGLEMSPQPMPLAIIQEKLLIMPDSSKTDQVEDVVVDQTASADKFMVL